MQTFDDSDAEDQNFEICSDEESSNGSNGSLEQTLQSEIDSIVDPGSEDQELSDLLRNASISLGCDNPETLFDIHQAIHTVKDDDLICLLLQYLPKLRTLFMVMPNDGAWQYERYDSVQKLIRKLPEIDPPNILQNLDTMYLCSSLGK